MIQTNEAKTYHRAHSGHGELEQPLCALGALWYDPPVLGGLLPQRAQRAQRNGETSVCSVV